MLPPKVSIVIPVYNRFELLQETVETILNQDYPNLELLLVDDNSPDGTGQRLSEFSDPRIRIYLNSKSLGAGATRNVGLRKATGEFLAFSDQDDLWSPNKVSEQVRHLKANPDCAMVGSWIQEFKSVDGQRQDLVLHQLFESHAHNEEFLMYTSPFVTCSSVMIRKRVLDEHALEFREDMGRSTCEDYDLWFRISQHGGLANIPAPLLNYRIHESQESRLASDAMKEQSNRVRKDILASRGIELTDEEFDAIVAIALWKNSSSSDEIYAASSVASKVTTALRSRSKSDEAIKFHYHLLAMHLNRSGVSLSTKLGAWAKYNMRSPIGLGTKLHSLNRILRCC